MKRFIFALILTLFAKPMFSQSIDGKSLYDENCKKCHGAIGTPPKTMKAKFPKIYTFDKQFIATRSNDSIVKILTKGKNEDMVSFNTKFNSKEMLAVAIYVRELSSKK